MTRSGASSAISSSPIALHELEEMYANDIACQGVTWVFQEPKGCPHGNPAIYVSYGHKGCSEDTPSFKCLDCYQVWRAKVQGVIDKHGSIYCCRCLTIFDEIDTFSHYREF